MEIAFGSLAVVCVLGALLAVSLRNLVHCVLGLVLFFLGVAGVFVLLSAEFLAAVQVLIYVGAVVVLVLFAIMLTHKVAGGRGVQVVTEGWWSRAVVAAGVFILIHVAIVHQAGLPVVPPTTPPTVTVAGGETVGGTKGLGLEIMSPFVLPFEVVSVLLTAAMIGAIVIALDEIRRRKKEDAGGSA